MDDKGHADEILVDLGTLVWVGNYDIFKNSENDFASTKSYETNLALIATAIVDEHKDD